MRGVCAGGAAGDHVHAALRVTRNPLRVLVIGQVPPPYGGQTIMTEVLVLGRYENAELWHVNAAFSRSLADMGTTSLIKVVRLLGVLARALATTARRRPEVLYFHPAGASKSAILRDIAMLLALRPFYRTVVFHLHARGLTESCGSMPPPLRGLARRVYAAPQLLVGPSAAIVEEAAGLRAQRQLVVPNGTAGGSPRSNYEVDGPVRIVFVNLISEAKGALWLLESLAVLVGRGIDVRLTYVGEVSSSEYQASLLDRAAALGVVDRIAFTGLAVGPDKWQRMAEADVFCVPTTWRQESFGLAMVEAASCGLPIVAADVPGVREVLDDGVSVLLADPDDRFSLTRQLEAVCRSPELRKRLGTAARAEYLHRYTMQSYWRRMEDVFELVRRLHSASA